MGEDILATLIYFFSSGQENVFCRGWNAKMIQTNLHLFVLIFFHDQMPIFLIFFKTIPRGSLCEDDSDNDMKSKKCMDV